MSDKVRRLSVSFTLVPGETPNAWFWFWIFRAFGVDWPEWDQHHGVSPHFPEMTLLMVIAGFFGFYIQNSRV